MATKVKLIADNAITTTQIDTSSLDSYFSGGTGVTYSSGEISIGQAIATTDSPTFADLTLTGNLNITGDLNSYNVTDLDITDQTITLGAGQTEALSDGSGIVIDGSGASILWDETNDTFDINKGLTALGNVGIGTDDPDATLHVEGNQKIVGNLFLDTNADGFRAIAMDTSDGADNESLYLCGGGTASGARGAVIGLIGNEFTNTGGQLNLTAGRASTGNIIFKTGATSSIERMRISSGGDLTFTGGNWSGADRFNFSVTQFDAGATFQTGEFLLFGDHDGTKDKMLTLKRAGSDVFTVDAGGNVGIGGDPYSLLHVTGGNTGFVASNGAGIYGIQVSRTTSRGENLYMYTTSDTGWSGSSFVGRVESYGNNAFEIGSQQNAPIIIGTNDAEKLRITSNTIQLNGGNQSYSDNQRVFSETENISWPSSTSAQSWTSSNYLPYQKFVEAALHFGYVGNGAISQHFYLSLLNNFTGLSIQTIQSSSGNSGSSYHTISFTSTGSYNSRRIVVQNTPASGQNTANLNGTIYYGLAR